MTTTFARLLMGVGWVCSAGLAFAQPAGSASAQAGMSALPLNDLSAFPNIGKNWSIVGDVTADLAKNNALTSSKGTGTLVNLPDDKNKSNLVTALQHGDVDLELDYMIAKGSNSGIYLQGRYEVQLLDSWGVKIPKAGDNGGIYERWDDSRPEGQKGYEGHAPRQNASRAPGLWQHLRISFQAPRFDAGGKKIENARMLLVELNGVTIHENVELTGPTRGPIANDEKPMGPLLIQGDHGPVAFRNIMIRNYDKPRPELTNLKYAVYKGKFDKEPDFAKLPPEAEGSSVILSSNVTRIPNEFLIRYTGTLKVKEPGEYAFNLGTAGGGGLMKINNQVVINPGDRGGRGRITLPAGDVPFELMYAKFMDWAKPSIGLAVSGPGIREYLISDAGSSVENEPVEPIMIDAPSNTILRSFMDLPNVRTAQGRPMRVVHAVSVGSPERVHYTYDMDKGALIQVWRGLFLDATPMWHSRGDGSSRPSGMVQRMGAPVLTIGRLASPQAPWAADTTGSGFRPKGYMLDESDRPTFRYGVYGAAVEDAIRVLENGQGVRRDISVQNPSGDLFARLAEGSTIETLPNGMYAVDGKSYYLRVDDAGGAKPSVRSVGSRQELIVPVRGKLSYSILF
ncbi:family 16 glycoside hydrolase [Larkinella soli]|uniref:family 16 glycoside hydrolase n=1 Tax=Larkinella soli TaxID=1770527 RepID=UPI001E28BA1A|nr:family 16 glycoside hydrolase [Larkinella soli]